MSSPIYQPQQQNLVGIKSTNIKLYNFLVTVDNYLSSLSNIGTGTNNSLSKNTNSFIAFSIPGTIGILTSAAPLLYSFSNLTITEFIAIVKTAPMGANITINILYNTTILCSTTITDGNSYGTTGPISIIIPARQALSLDIITVGTTFPGADLSVIGNISA